jgi:hypothetical protein
VEIVHEWSGKWALGIGEKIANPLFHHFLLEDEGDGSRDKECEEPFWPEKERVKERSDKKRKKKESQGYMEKRCPLWQHYCLGSSMGEIGKESGET